jgi:hypothetical protein
MRLRSRRGEQGLLRTTGQQATDTWGGIHEEDDHGVFLSPRFACSLCGCGFAGQHRPRPGKRKLNQRR